MFFCDCFVLSFASFAQDCSRMILVSITVAFTLSALALVLQKCGAEWRQFLTLGDVGKEKDICTALKVCASQEKQHAT